MTLTARDITFRRESFPIAEVAASVESVGSIRQRGTLTRTIATGGLGLFLFKKKVDDRDLFLTIEGPSFQWLVDVDPRKQKEAREFAAQINSAARSWAAPPQEVRPATEPVDAPSESEVSLGPPPGWLLDPSNADLMRWWNGREFTELTKPSGA